MTADHRLDPSVDLAWGSAEPSGGVATLVRAAPAVLPSSEASASTLAVPGTEPQAEPRSRQGRLGALSDDTCEGRRPDSRRSPWYRGLWAWAASALSAPLEDVARRAHRRREEEATRRLFDVGLHHVR